MRPPFTALHGRNGARGKARGREHDIFVLVRPPAKNSARFQPWGILALAVVAIGGVIAGGTIAAYVVRRAVFLENPRYRLRAIDARSDGRLTPEQIVEFSGLANATRLFEVNPRQARARLHRLPSVKSASVRRRLPDTIEVRVTERVPLACVALREAGYTDAADREGVLLGPRFASSGLPLIEGLQEAGLRPGERLTSPAARAALSVLDLCETTRIFQYLRVRRLDASPEDHMILELENGDRVLFPRERIESKLRRLATILKTIADQGLPRGPGPLEIDLTTEEVFPVRGLRWEASNAARPSR
jgi:cell division protein FtsQ